MMGGSEMREARRHLARIRKGESVPRYVARIYRGQDAEKRLQLQRWVSRLLQAARAEKDAAGIVNK